MTSKSKKRFGFFTRLLDDVAPGERYRLATEQIVHAERLGLESAWVAQHHFHAAEGGLPAPFVFLAQVAARTSAIRLGTGIVTLPLESPLRVAEDASVLDALSGGRLEVGMGSGGTPASFAAFGQDSDRRGDIFAAHLRVVLNAWRGDTLGDSDNRLYPAAPHLLDRIWQATFSVAGGARAGLAGDGLMLSRTQPRPPDAPGATLSDIQRPIVDAYHAALPAGRAPRILGSRSIFVTDDRAEAHRLGELGMDRFAAFLAAGGRPRPIGNLEDMLAASDIHIGTPEDVIASLRADSTLESVTDIVCQVHPIDPPHPFILRSIELFATVVAPALGWSRPVDRGAGKRDHNAVNRR